MIYCFSNFSTSKIKFLKFTELSDEIRYCHFCQVCAVDTQAYVQIQFGTCTHGQCTARKDHCLRLFPSLRPLPSSLFGLHFVLLADSASKDCSKVLRRLSEKQWPVEVNREGRHRQ